MTTMKNNAVVTSPEDEEDPGETISHGELELEPPGHGTTFENPPDGGVRAWLIVLSCTLINAMMSVMLIMVRVSLLDTEMSKDTAIDSETLNEMDTQLIALIDLYGMYGCLVTLNNTYVFTVLVQDVSKIICI